MSKMLSFAVEAASALPESLQDEIGRTVLDHVRKLQELRSEIQAGLNSLEKSGGRELTPQVWNELKAEAIRRAGEA